MKTQCHDWLGRNLEWVSKSGKRLINDMGEQYFKGVLAGYLGANFMCGPITEWQMDIIKENISHYCEATIDHSYLSHPKHGDRRKYRLRVHG